MDEKDSFKRKRVNFKSALKPNKIMLLLLLSIYSMIWHSHVAENKSRPS